MTGSSIVMVDALFLVSILIGATLVVLLAMTVAGTSLRVWPLPMEWTLKSVAFWGLFRALNILAAVVALVDFSLWEDGFSSLRLAGFVVAVTSFMLFLYAGAWLGKKNLYGGSAGLETRGIYRFTRNPQYAAAIPGCVGLGIASYSLPAFFISGTLAGVYALMAKAEETWLEETYGSAYAAYKATVPRFYNWHGLYAAFRAELSRAPAREADGI